MFFSKIFFVFLLLRLGLMTDSPLMKAKQVDQIAEEYLKILRTYTVFYFSMLKHKENSKVKMKYWRGDDTDNRCLL